MTAFGRYAKYYDLLYKDKDYERESEYISALLKKYKPDTESILELGCGTGSHATIFARNGYAVHGIDYSKDMIKEAVQRTHSLSSENSNRLYFQHADIRNVRINRKFDAVVALFHVISYQISNDDVLQTFSTAAEHLDASGLFIFDCWYGPAVLTDRPESRTKQFRDDTYHILREAVPTVRPNDNLVDIYYNFSVTDGQIIDKFQEQHKMRYFFRPEVAILLSVAGLEIIDCYRWLTTNAPGTDSWYVVFLAKVK